MREEKIVFFGTTSFSCVILKTLIEEQYHVAAVVSQPDKPVGRRHRIEPTPIHAMCTEYGIPCIQPEKLRLETDAVLQYEPDLIVTCAYGQIVPDVILEYPRLGCINVHPSLLPKYRGGAPMHYAILNGDRETGVSLMEMTHRMDAGKVYAQVRIPLGEDETLAELEPRLMETSAAMIKEYLPQYIDGKLPGTEQNEDEVTISHNISKEDEMVHFQSESLEHLYNHIRALIDWPLSYGIVDGKRIKFYKVRAEYTACEIPAGTIIDFNGGAMNISADGGILHVYELQMEGKKKMDAKAFANGYAKELTGKRFE